ncbi:hypothetical protein M501DRAFT_993016 [Patellaria atrata CBS 101060]|uniref:AAA+ ATPase domain-containing protein n=1 Tax=Patellaria atrata CBS 101060 TaxID=1346257 RepID=A0A9P4S8R4_9PEZI|nr:hypothetical protein M501DRAFT_993016 [Patellaria atrata CBS 101060]
MAVALVERAMNLGERKPVHPFFSKTQNSKSELENIAIPDPETLHLDENGAHEAASSIDENRKVGGKRASHGRKTSKRRKKDTLVNTESTSQTLLTTFAQSGVSSNLAPNLELESHPAGNVDISLEEDPNKDRRKRRKTDTPPQETPKEATSGPHPTEQSLPASPPTSLSWHEQLLAVADKGADQELDSSLNISDVQAPTCEVEVEDTETLASSKVRSDGCTENITQCELQQNCDASGQIITNTRPKKMLRLRGNGRFSSPVAPASAKEAVEPHASPPRKRKKRKSRGMVIIKYGRDLAARVSLGAKIATILSKSKEVPKAAENASDEKDKLPAITKETHPFFLGKNLKDSKIQNKDNDSQRRLPDIPAERKASAVTPGKLRAKAEALHPDKFPVFGATVLGSTQAKLTRHPGAQEPCWPCKENVHVRGLHHDLHGIHGFLSDDRSQGVLSASNDHRKLKNKVMFVTEEEDIMLRCARDLFALSMPTQGQLLRTPQRLLISGVTLRERLCDELSFSIRQETSGSNESTQLHAALRRLYDDVPSTLSSFDRHTCESQAWTHKYSPKTASEVLQLGKEVMVLKEWMQKLTVTAVDSGPKTIPKTVRGKELADKVVKKKRKRKDLDDFIISDEDDADQLDELSEPEDTITTDSVYGQKRSVVRNGGQASDGIRPGKGTNIVLISGPSGCGKTAAVYAVAHELGFEVFEINSNSRRSGKDILDRIGDMTENHLVQKAAQSNLSGEVEDIISEVPDTLQMELESGRQAKMDSFFKFTAKPQSKTKKTPCTVNADKKTVHRTKTNPQQKQSLILLEEVDILFEEDKQFWATVVALAANSKRPIIMTCNDEMRVPLDPLSYHAILRFSPPPVDIAVDYLLLLAANEGHLIKRLPVSELYENKKHDLRASITELNFWCQMGIGDKKGGLEWIYQRWPAGCDLDEHGRKLRVVSETSYQSSMGWCSHDILCAEESTTFNKTHVIMSEAWTQWKIDPYNWQEASVHCSSTGHLVSSENSKGSNLMALRNLERVMDAASAADVYCRTGLPTGALDPIDTTLPPMSESARNNYIEGLHLLEADPVINFSNMDMDLSISTHLTSHRLKLSYDIPQDLISAGPPSRFDDTKIAEAILSSIKRQDNSRPINRESFSCFDPIAEDSGVSIFPGSAAFQLTASSFDRSFCIIVTDLAPYVRSIAAHDLRLDAERLRMSNLLSVGGSSKKRRSTRAARSALEGGRRETMRRERWFNKSLNLNLVMATAGESWAGMSGVDERTVESKTGSTHDEEDPWDP